jgi:GTP-binding protein Era
MNQTPEIDEFRAGYVSILGRANVGKSTLLNKLLGTKIAAVSPKPQTSRDNLLGIVHGDKFELSLLDTPGWPKSVNIDTFASSMIKDIREAIDQSDLILLMSAPRPPGTIERSLIKEIKDRKKPAILAINKIDTLRKSAILPVIEQYTSLYPFEEIIPVSVLKEDNLDILINNLAINIPKGPPKYKKDQITDRSISFILAEIIREKIFIQYGDEIPYSTAVKIESFQQNNTGVAKKDLIEATIYIERASQKAILVGREGKALKEVGIDARVEIEKFLQRSIYLNLWVKTKEKWKNDEQFVRELGQDD